MPPDESRRSREDFERMVARHAAAIEEQRSELAHRRRELEAGMERLRSEMATAREAFERAIENGGDAFRAARKYCERFGAWPPRKPRNGRRGRGMDGGDPAPVKPRPKPTPLMDGAEAPIE